MATREKWRKKSNQIHTLRELQPLSPWECAAELPFGPVTQITYSPHSVNEELDRNLAFSNVIPPFFFLLLFPDRALINFNVPQVLDCSCSP